MSDYTFLRDSIPEEETFMITEDLRRDDVDIESEWHVFVHEGEIVDIRRYARTDIAITPPSMRMIRKMIGQYSFGTTSDSLLQQKTRKEQLTTVPKAYTLDVVVDTLGLTYLMEVHPFVSCGTYRFSDSSHILSMAIKGYKWLVENAKKRRRKWLN